ncbi:MAG: hypothetical protein ACI8PT_004954 [Gammaproteobacteria bacterium]|jgi:hypothetical protein
MPEQGYCARKIHNHEGNRIAGRPRKPTSILELSGAFKKDLQRRAARANEPKLIAEIG